MTTKRLIILGAGGHSKVVADIAARTRQYANIAYLDDGLSVGTELKGGEVVAGVADWQNYFQQGVEFFVAIGNNAARQRLCSMLLDDGASLATLIHPSAIVADDVVVGSGSLVVAGAVINPATTIGLGCIVNTNASIDHDCKIGDYVHIAPGSNLAGTITVGHGSFLGIGSKVIPARKIGNNVTLGAGAVVVNDISDGKVVVGCPARELVKVK